MKYFKIVLLIILVGHTLFLHGTVQIPETLIAGGDTLYLEEYPLDDKLKQDSSLLDQNWGDNNDISLPPCFTSNCWRGYVGTWMVVNDSLFLTKLIPPCDWNGAEPNPFSLEKLFPNEVTPYGVFAEWMRGQLFEKCTSHPCDTLMTYILLDGVVHMSGVWDLTEYPQSNHEVTAVVHKNHVSPSKPILKWYSRIPWYAYVGITLIFLVMTIAIRRKSR